MTVKVETPLFIKILTLVSKGSTIIICNLYHFVMTKNILKGNSVCTNLGNSLHDNTSETGMNKITVKGK